MTTTYDITTNVGKVRLKIGDTAATYVFTDEEIGVFLTDQSNNILMASADALEAWAAKYATNAMSENITNYAYTQKSAENLSKLASKYRSIEASIPVFDYAEMDLTEWSLIEESE